MAAGFRYEPSSLGADVLYRPRLVGALAQRFDCRVTQVSAAAGFGKTTLLVLALQSNLVEPRGVDVWFGAIDADRDPEHLLAGIAHAFGVDPSGSPEQIRRRITDAVWTRAPDDVCLLVDDAHLIKSDAARDELGRLIHELPANGHMLLSTRPAGRMPLARLRAADAVLDLTEAELALDDDELRAMAARHAGGDGRNGSRTAIDELPRHAATARLTLLVGEEASAEFLWEEVLSSIHQDRLADLARLSVLEEFDSHLVDALTDGRHDALTLVEGIPLVDALDDGTWRFHALLRRALRSRLEEGVDRKMLSVAAEVERRRSRMALAIELHEQARDPIAVLDTARELVMRPILRHSIEDILVARRALEQIDPDGAVLASVNAHHLWIAAAGISHGLTADVLPAIRRAAGHARDSNDVSLESLQHYMLVQLELLDHLEPSTDSIARLEELAAAGDPFAEALWAVTRGSVARRSGDVAGALAALEPLRTSVSPDAQLLLHSEYTDIGRPELVHTDLTPDDVANQSSNAALMSSFGMWLRGAAPPELALAVTETSIPNVLRRGFDVASVSSLGVGAVIAVTAGEWDIARRRIDQARPLAEAGIAKSVELWYPVGAAALALEEQSERSAAELLDPQRTGVRFAPFPERPHLTILSLLYVVRPDARKVLDTVEFGPSLATAVRAGRAVLAARHGDLSAAVELPWESTNLLRALVLPRHLIELACAAIVGGAGHTREAADHLLRTLPHLHQHLTRVAEHPHRPIAALAKQLSGGVARRAPYRLHAQLLGTVTLLRDGVPLTHTDFDRRAKVRELWAYLVEHRECSRADVIEALWPGYADETKALGNLRSALATLQRVLEPDRDTSTAPYFLRTDNDRLLLDRSITTDVEQFERLAADARDADASGLPARSKELHRRAAALYRGDYLMFLDTGWATLTRVRLQALAVGSMCRVAELSAAQGEPEEALHWAHRALRVDPLAERAIVTMLSSMQATGAVSAARAAAREALDRLSDAGLEPGPGLQRMIDRLR